MASSAASEEICEFIWQYEQRKKWHLFSNAEAQLLNEAVKQKQYSTTIPAKKLGEVFVIDFIQMRKIDDVSFYEQRIRCLIGDCNLYVWSWKNCEDEWIGFSPFLTFLLETAYQKHEMKICLSNCEFNLEKFEMLKNESEECDPIKREEVQITSKAIQAIVEKNKSIFETAFSQEFSSLKRSLDVTNITFYGNQSKKRRQESPATDQTKSEIILPIPGISNIKDNLGTLKTLKNGNSALDSVPIDAECPIKADYSIYFEVTAFSATLNQTNLQNNNNKFYIIQLLRHKQKEEYCVWRRWGRVGQRGQTNLNKYGTSLSEAKKEFEGKFFDKTKNYWNEADKFVHVKGKYDMLHINLSPQEKEVAVNVKSKLFEELKNLMELICDTRRMEEIMKEMYYDSKKTPLGQLTSLQVKNGYIALNKIAMILKRGGSNNELVNACNDFYTKIPHNYGMKRPPIIKSQAELEEKQKMLEALTNIQVAMNVMNAEADIVQHPLDKYYISLNCSLDCIKFDSPEYMEIEKCLKETHGPTHNNYDLEIVSVFKCFKRQEEESFIDSNNKLVLWHGSRIVNWLGILKDGLRIAPPEAPTTGYMFGKGIYFADVSSKSANYCYATKKKNEGLLIMCEVSLGKQSILLEADETMPDNLPKDCSSVFGKGRLCPADFKLGILSPEAKVPVGPLLENPEHKGSLHYNEYIVYNTRRVKMKYLVRVKFSFK